MKLIIVCSLIASMVFTPNVVRADAFMDDANKMLKFEKQNVENYVNIRLSQDVNDLLNNIFFVSQGLSDQVNKLNAIDIEMNKIETQFSEISNFQILQDKNLEEIVTKLNDVYRIQNHKFFDQSWTPSTAAIFRDEFITTVSQMVAGLKYQCTVGRNDISFNPAVPVSPPPPKLAFSFLISTSTGDERNGVQYSQYNYKPSKDVQNIQRYAGYGSAVGGTVLASMYGNALMNGASLSTVSAQAGTMTAAAATGVAIAIVVAIAVISYFSGAKKRFKLMKQYHAAELYKFYNSLTSADMSRMYKDRCQEIVGTLDESLIRINSLAQGGSAAEHEKARYYQEDEHINSLNEEITELISLDAKIEAMKKDKASEDELKPLLERETALNDQLDKKSLINMAAHYIVGAFGIKAEKAFHDFKVNNAQSVMLQRQKALLKIQTLLDTKSGIDFRVLDSEKSSFKEYLSLRSEFLNILSDTFEYIWGKKNKNTVYSKVKNFHVKIDSMTSKYLQVDEFRALKASSDWLIHFFEREP
jgi:hypothetical protein